MNTKKTASKLQGNKTANKKSELLGKAIKALDNLTQTSSKQETKKESNYKVKVLESNKLLKQESVKLGYCVKVLINNTNILKLSPLMVKNLNAINKDSEVYKLAVLNCRKSKNGNYSPFYLLQYLYSISK
jgi:hypothetical protein